MIPGFLNNFSNNIINNIINIDNLYLLYNKYYKGEYENAEKESFYKLFLRKANNLDSNYLSNYKVRFNSYLDYINTIGFDYKKIKLKTDWRLVVGLGNESVMETSISLHPLYGFPYIPSSAVKGVARAYAVLCENKAVDETDIKINVDAEINDVAKQIFGEKEQVGNILFYDAIPEKLKIFDLDIINSLHNNYYSNNSNYPRDWEAPSMNSFITIKPDSEFSFYLVAEDKDLLELAATWVEKGLKELGIGGKTSAGYGHFINNKNITLNDDIVLSKLANLGRVVKGKQIK